MRIVGGNIDFERRRLATTLDSLAFRFRFPSRTSGLRSLFPTCLCSFPPTSATEGGMRLMSFNPGDLSRRIAISQCAGINPALPSMQCLKLDFDGADLLSRFFHPAVRAPVRARRDRSYERLPAT